MNQSGLKMFDFSLFTFTFCYEKFGMGLLGFELDIIDINYSRSLLHLKWGKDQGWSADLFFVHLS